MCNTVTQVQFKPGQEQQIWKFVVTGQGILYPATDKGNFFRKKTPNLKSWLEHESPFRVANFQAQLFNRQPLIEGARWPNWLDDLILVKRPLFSNSFKKFFRKAVNLLRVN